MKSLIFIALIFIVGCIPTVSQRIEGFESLLDKSAQKADIDIDSSYREVFKATIYVFRDLNFRIFEKDFKKKVISATVYQDYYGHHLGGAYRANFETDNGKKIKIILTIVERSGHNYYQPEIILEKIREEINLQNELGHQ